MLSVIKAEIRQILHARWVWWAVVSVLLIEILSAVVYHKSADMQNSPLPSAFEILGFALRSGVLVTIFFLLGTIAMSIAGEESSGVLKTVLSKLASRWQYLSGKLIVFSLTGFGLILLSVTGSIILGAIYGNYESMTEGAYVIVAENQLWTNLLLTILFILLPMFASLCTGLFFSSISRNSGLAVVLTFGFFIGSFLMTFSDFSLVFDVEHGLLTRYISFPVDTFYNLTKGLPVTWAPDIESILMGSSIYVIVFSSITTGLFIKRDFS